VPHFFFINLLSSHSSNILIPLSVFSFRDLKISLSPLLSITSLSLPFRSYFSHVFKFHPEAPLPSYELIRSFLRLESSFFPPLLFLPTRIVIRRDTCSPSCSLFLFLVVCYSLPLSHRQQKTPRALFSPVIRRPSTWAPPFFSAPNSPSLSPFNCPVLGLPSEGLPKGEVSPH